MASFKYEALTSEWNDQFYSWRKDGECRDTAERESVCWVLSELLQWLISPAKCCSYSTTPHQIKAEEREEQLLLCDIYTYILYIHQGC